MSIQGRRPQASVCGIVVGLPPVQVELNRWRDGRETHTRTFFSIFSSSHSTDSLDASCSPRPHVSSAAHENGYTFSPNHCHLRTFALVSGTEEFPTRLPLPNLAQFLRFVKRWDMTRRTAPEESGGPPRSWSASASAIGFHERGREREEGRELPNSRAHFTHLVVTRGRSAPRPCRVSPPPDSLGRSTEEGDEGIGGSSCCRLNSDGGPRVCSRRRRRLVLPCSPSDTDSRAAAPCRPCVIYDVSPPRAQHATHSTHASTPLPPSRPRRFRPNDGQRSEGGGGEARWAQSSASPPSYMPSPFSTDMYCFFFFPICPLPKCTY